MGDREYFSTRRIWLQRLARFFDPSLLPLIDLARELFQTLPHLDLSMNRDAAPGGVDERKTIFSGRRKAISGNHRTCFKRSPLLSWTHRATVRCVQEAKRVKPSPRQGVRSTTQMFLASLFTFVDVQEDTHARRCNREDGTSTFVFHPVIPKGLDKVAVPFGILVSDFNLGPPS